jgi:hypothetical protein
VCRGGVCEGGGGRAFYYTYIYSGKRESCEGAELVGVLDERVSKGQASERAVCHKVCVREVVSVEKGARRPLLPAAVVCPPGGRRRRRLAITAVTL